MRTGSIHFEQGPAVGRIFDDKLTPIDTVYLVLQVVVVVKVMVCKITKKDRSLAGAALFYLSCVDYP